MKLYTPVGGTHDWGRTKWWKCVDEEDNPLPFASYMLSQGFICKRREDPFWSGALGGVPLYKRKVWAFGATVLKEWMEREVPLVKDRRILSVSHGGQVAMMACARGLKVASLVTITMPQRADMEDTYRSALENIGTYTNVYSDSWWRDRWQILGTITDGSFRFRRRFQLEGVDATNIGIPGVGHTALVKDGECMPLLKTSGVLGRL
jgi:hypothetical protein